MVGSTVEMTREGSAAAAVVVPFLGGGFKRSLAGSVDGAAFRFVAAVAVEAGCVRAGRGKRMPVRGQVPM